MMAEPPAHISRDRKENDRQHPQDYHGDSMERNLCLCGGDIDVGSYLRKNENFKLSNQNVEFTSQDVNFSRPL